MLKHAFTGCFTLTDVSSINPQDSPGREAEEPAPVCRWGRLRLALDTIVT